MINSLSNDVNSFLSTNLSFNTKQQTSAFLRELFLKEENSLGWFQISPSLRERTIVHLDAEDLEAIEKKANECVLKVIYISGIASKYIPQESDRIKLAKLTALAGRYNAHFLIEKYDIKDEAAQLELAKLDIQLAGFGDFEHVDKYSFKSQAAWIELAKIAIKRNAVRFYQHIDKFQVKDEVERIELAKHALQTNAEMLCKRFDKFQITNEAARIDIAKMAAKLDPRAISEHFDKFQITDEAARVDIAKLAIHEDSFKTCRWFENYHITDEAARTELATLAIKLQGASWFFIKNYHIEIDEALRIDLAMDAAATYLSFTNCSDPVKQYAIEDQQAAKTISLICNTRKKLEYRCLSQEDIQEFCSDSNYRSKKVMTALAKYRNTEIALRLFTIILKNENALYWHSYERDRPTMHMCLPMIVLTKWAVETGKTVSLKGLQKRRGDFRNHEHPLMQSTLLGLLGLDKVSTITAGNKLRIATEILESDNPVRGFGLLAAILFNEKNQDLNHISENTLLDFFGASLLKNDGWDGIEGVLERYWSTFGQMRYPQALEVYKKDLDTELGVKEHLNRFERSVLLDTFEEERCRTDNNPHLEKIQSEAPHVLAAWNTLKATVDVAQVDSGPKESFSYESFFRQKLHDLHWHIKGEDQLPELTCFLITHPDERDLLPEATNEFAKACINLLKQPSLERLQEALFVSLYELKHDLKGLWTSMTAPINACKETATLTRDWQDLFLCGTEVSGSCQRIDGSAHLKKCLLAYCLDGKNAVVAVKNEQGRMVARRILRLLWDDTHKTPALFLERTYPSNCPANREEALALVAKECAVKLNCRLFEAGTSQDIALCSLGSSCRDEYADAAGGLIAGQSFKIDGVQEML